MASGKKVLMVTPECVLFVKTGGLADVVGVLPKILNKLGNDVRVILPLYSQFKYKYVRDMTFIRWTTVKMGWRNVYSGLFKLKVDGVTYYFIDNEAYFDNPSVYTDDIRFDIERFSFFQRAVLDALGEPMDFYPDIIHCHDWQTAMIPVLLDSQFKPFGYFTNVKTVFTIHNLKYQGVYGMEEVADYLDLPRNYLTEWGVLHNGDVNFMKSGIVYADLVTTVSPTYSQEIMMPFYGEGLDGILRNFSYKVRGVLNGIDVESYNPATDVAITKNYDAKTVFEDKAKNKIDMQKDMALEVDPDKPLTTMVSRLVSQKGFDLIIRIIDELMQEDVQFILLGTGDGHYEYEMYLAEQRNHKNLRSVILYDDNLARKLYAAGDIFLMPSIFEPCGLSQMIAMRYGNVPLVRETGGLKDTVEPYNVQTGEGNGFSFPNINAHEMLFLLKDALNLYHNSRDEHWKKIVQNAMAEDFSWTRSAKEYDKLYDQVLNNEF